MSHHDLPQHYRSIRQRFPDVTVALEELGKQLREHGPLEPWTAHLVQMAAAAASGSESAAASHARRALEAGASADALYHAALLLVTTIGFPRAAALIAWVDDVVESSE